MDGGVGFRIYRAVNSDDFWVITMSANDRQVGGDHYRRHKIQPWDIVEMYDLDFFLGNALKYILRNKTNRREDIKKAIHCLERWLEKEESGPPYKYGTFPDRDLNAQVTTELMGYTQRILEDEIRANLARGNNSNPSEGGGGKGGKDSNDL